MEITAGAVALFIAMLLLLALLVIYASGVGKRAHTPVDGVPTGNPAMERKVIAILGMMIVSGLILTGYSFWEPVRAAAALDRQENISIERGIENYTTLCMSCHGVAGNGAVVPDSTPPRVAPQLNRADMRPTDPDEYKTRYDFVYKTIARGRPGTPMPAWGREDGGSLLPEQIHELALMITKGDKSIHGKTVWDEVRAVAQEKIAHGSPAPIVPELQVAAELTDEQKLGSQLWTGKGACVGCHVIGGVGGATGPPQTQMGAVAETRVPGESAEEYIRQSILQPQAYLVPGFAPVMPSYQGILTDEEVNAIVSYLLTLR
jgi:mono/diheme cytochrome c family protein